MFDVATTFSGLVAQGYDVRGLYIRDGENAREEYAHDDIHVGLERHALREVESVFMGPADDSSANDSAVVCEFVLA